LCNNTCYRAIPEARSPGPSQYAFWSAFMASFPEGVDAPDLEEASRLLNDLR
jgi:hypothetical protein